MIAYLFIEFFHMTPAKGGGGNIQLELLCCKPPGNVLKGVITQG